MTSAPPRSSRFADLGVRSASAVVLGLIALADVAMGGVWLALFAAVAGAVMLWEFHRIVSDDARSLPPALLASCLTAALAALSVWAFGIGPAGVIAVMGALVVSRLAAAPTRGWLAAGVFYIVLALCFIVMLRGEGPQGFGVVLWLFLTVIAADVGAYFVGRSVGGPKLWPAVSPGKTRSGALGGLAAGIATGAIAALVFGWPPLRIGLLSAGIAVASQAGDLLESAVKRRFAVKDASGLIPGHGGLMDRLDGVLGAAWFLAAYVLLGGDIAA